MRSTEGATGVKSSIVLPEGVRTRMFTLVMFVFLRAASGLAGGACAVFSAPADGGRSVMTGSVLGVDWCWPGRVIVNVSSVRAWVSACRTFAAIPDRGSGSVGLLSVRAGRPGRLPYIQGGRGAAHGLDTRSGTICALWRGCGATRVSPQGGSFTRGGGPLQVEEEGRRRTWGWWRFAFGFPSS